MSDAHAAARRLSCRLETLWDFDDEPAHHGLESPYFTEVLIPRLRRLGLASPRVEGRYREIGLLDAAA
jgi:hypothetical protein